MLEIKDFIDFSITSWYENFKHVSLKTIIIELPDHFVKQVTCSENEVNCAEDYASFEEKLKNAINTLDKSVFVKNNWHAPTDARMFSFGNSLKACNIDDIILYFNTSGTIQEDFSSTKGIPFCLALRKWVSIHPAAEFRCIIINNVLRGITPRDWPTYYAHFKVEGPQIIDQLRNFYNENIRLKFPRKNYIVDIVMSYPDDPFILDFGPLNSKTNLYAFTWKEIQPLISKECPEDIPPVFRYLETDIGIMTRAAALNKFARSQNM
ncbi:cell division cycle protein 123 homolog [Anoplophora glabripennis]|nr:cell division cycle protein 123 homolog [Anoplophora glabripennis]